jgi:hypothetical protein
VALDAADDINQARSVSTRTATLLLEVFVVAIALAFLVTVSTGTFEMQILAAGLVVPIIILSLVFVRYCGRGKAWSYAGASVLGAIGAALRVVVSTQPNLEVGGGLPIGVTVFYVVLGTLVALLNFESALELRASPSSP